MRRLPLCLLLVLAGCAGREVGLMRSQGALRVEPHPADPAAYRLSIDVMPDVTTVVGPFNAAKPEGLRTVITELLGERCADAAVTQEGAIPLSPGVGIPPPRREQRIYKVSCPAS